MSEFTDHKALRIKKIESFCIAIINRDNPQQVVKENWDLIENINPEDVISVVHNLSKLDFSMATLKEGINKVLNLFYKALNQNDWQELKENSFFSILLQNNQVLDKKLKEIRQFNRDINKNPENTETIKELKNRFTELIAYDSYYQLKENVIFPVLEKKWTDIGCLAVMWSFHDDIRRALKQTVAILTEKKFDLKEFNRVSAKVFFVTNAIKFREEQILYPMIIKTISKKEIDKMHISANEFNLPFAKLKQKKTDNELDDNKEINLGTGYVTAKEISLMFNHLPVDITYVDENDKVKYFSTPKKRFFPRTNSIIGRNVRNCHPKESVDVVENIIDAFRKGKKDSASFWIRIKDMFLLIQYFAIRDTDKTYRGVLEVTQEINEIQEIKGEKRLLDWEK